MFLVEIKGGLSNYHQTKCWNESVVEVMLVQTLKSHRNLQRSLFSIFIQKNEYLYFAKLCNAINPMPILCPYARFMPIPFRLTIITKQNDKSQIFSAQYHLI